MESSEMSKNTDYKEDLEYIMSRFDGDGIKAPDSLSEDTIMAMLRDLPDGAITESADPAPENGQFAPVRPKKHVSFRKWAAAAACALIALIGVTQVYDAVTAPPDTGVVNGELYTFKSKSEIEHLISSLDESPGFSFGKRLDVVEESEMATGESSDVMANDSEADGMVSSEAKSSASSGNSASEHSETYLQVEEVDEADIVKTDGKYIYYVNSAREVVILSAENGKTRQLAKIGSSGVENYVHDIFLKGDTLVTVGYVYDEDEGYTGVVTYDISDRSRPEPVSEMRQTGQIISSRMVGNYVYLVTTDSVFKGGRTVPMVMDGGDLKEMDASDICCIPEPQRSSYIVLSAMDITSGSQTRHQTRAIFGATDDIYCNDHNLYAVSYEWDDRNQTTYTRIVRASLDGLNVKFNATARVRGHIDDQFSMDEKDGYFRIATTAQRDGMDVNNLFVLDGKLKEVGKVTGFARNESIKSVRYFGDKAYVITYEAIDPLFVIDLNDPANPVIEGEVKIDGFSTLLVPAGEGKLLGIGHATGDNGYGGEYASGLKLVLFDISDPSEPKVIDSKEFKDMDSPAQETHKALTVNSKEGWYAVPYGIWSYPDVIDEEPVEINDAEESSDVLIEEDTEEEPGYEAGVLVFGADDKLNVYDQHKLGSDQLHRCVYIGDYIYALDDEGNALSFKFTK